MSPLGFGMFLIFILLESKKKKLSSPGITNSTNLLKIFLKLSVAHLESSHSNI